MLTLLFFMRARGKGLCAVDRDLNFIAHVSDSLSKKKLMCKRKYPLRNCKYAPKKSLSNKCWTYDRLQTSHSTMVEDHCSGLMLHTLAYRGGGHGAMVPPSKIKKCKAKPSSFSKIKAGL